MLESHHRPRAVEHEDDLGRLAATSTARRKVEHDHRVALLVLGHQGVRHRLRRHAEGDDDVLVELDVAAGEVDAGPPAAHLHLHGMRRALHRRDVAPALEVDAQGEAVGHTAHDGRRREVRELRRVHRLELLGRDVARRDRGRDLEAHLVAEALQRRDVGEPHDRRLPGQQVADAGREQVRPILVEQVGAVAARHRLVVLLEGFLSPLDDADDAPVVDLDLEAADGRRLFEREGVDGLDGDRLTVEVALRDGHRRGRPPRLDVDDDAGQRHIVLADEQAGGAFLRRLERAVLA